MQKEVVAKGSGSNYPTRARADGDGGYPTNTILAMMVGEQTDALKTELLAVPKQCVVPRSVLELVVGVDMALSEDRSVVDVDDAVQLNVLDVDDAVKSSVVAAATAVPKQSVVPRSVLELVGCPCSGGTGKRERLRRLTEEGIRGEREGMRYRQCQCRWVALLANRSLPRYNRTTTALASLVQSANLALAP